MKTRIGSLSKYYESKILEADENIKILLNTKTLYLIFKNDIK